MRGDVFICYGTSDTRLNVATSTVEKLLDYTVNTPEDPLRSFLCVRQRHALIGKKLALLKTYGTVSGRSKEPGKKSGKHSKR
ncbi:MAG: hypothetical protein ACLPLR_04115 [Terriglobales bacterium]